MLDLVTLANAKTPWGQVQNITGVLSDGIALVDTDCGQAFKVCDEWNQKIAIECRVESGWYDLDTQWAAIALTFSRFFKPHDIEEARSLARAQWPSLAA